MKYPKSNNYVFFDEIYYSSSSGFTEWYGLRPLGEILCNHKDPYVPIGRWIDRFHQVKPPGMEGSWSDHALQALWMGMDQIGLHLAAMTFPYKFCCIPDRKSVV